jgi:hypothetical protein
VVTNVGQHARVDERLNLVFLDGDWGVGNQNAVLLEEEGAGSYHVNSTILVGERVEKEQHVQL